jgi:hypothetical protein
MYLTIVCYERIHHRDCSDFVVLSPRVNVFNKSMLVRTSKYASMSLSWRNFEASSVCASFNFKCNLSCSRAGTHNSLCSMGFRHSLEVSDKVSLDLAKVWGKDAQWQVIVMLLLKDLELRMVKMHSTRLDRLTRTNCCILTICTPY